MLNLPTWDKPAFAKSLGYKYVTLDLEGYRPGSMNETLTKNQLSLEGLREL
jgi:hypothetical protein